MCSDGDHRARVTDSMAGLLASNGTNEDFGKFAMTLVNANKPEQGPAGPVPVGQGVEQGSATKETSSPNLTANPAPANPAPAAPAQGSSVYGSRFNRSMVNYARFGQTGGGFGQTGGGYGVPRR